MLAPCGVGFLVVCVWCLAIPQKAAGIRAYTFLFAMSQIDNGFAMNDQRLNNVILPIGIDNIIYNELGAVYNPDHFKFSYNLDHTKDDILVYLGTYFPRSFAEAYIIMCDLLDNEAIRSTMAAREEIFIFDFGCGTGGEIFGTMFAITDIFGASKTFNVVVVDGNSHATRMYDRVLSLVNRDFAMNVKSGVYPFIIDDAVDMELLGDAINKRFDIMLSFKAVNEFIQRKRFAGNAYRHFCEMLVPKLAEGGLFVLLDVTTCNEETGMYYPIMMNAGVNAFLKENREFATLLPIPCACKSLSCSNPCYMQRRFYVSHSHRKDDLSKVAYRVIGRSDFIAGLHLPLAEAGVAYIVNDNGSVCCPCCTGDMVEEGFNLKQ